MRFDTIIGNPPYQQKTEGYGAQAKPVYQHFVRQAKKMNPKYLSLIIPARWFTGGMGLKGFRREMLTDTRISELHDYPNCKDCFPHVEIKGGVCFFLWRRDHAGMCRVITHRSPLEPSCSAIRFLKNDLCDTLIRYPEHWQIAEKVWKGTAIGSSFRSLVSSVNPFGLATDFFKMPSKYGLPPVSKTKMAGQSNDSLIIFGLDEKFRRTKRYVPADYPFPSGKDIVGKWKVFVPEAGENGRDKKVIGLPFIGPPHSLCTFTFLNVGTFETKKEAENCLGYMKTAFFRFLVSVIKTTQHTTRRVFQLVPMQDFRKPWDDAALYAKYGFTPEEIALIEKKICRLG